MSRMMTTAATAACLMFLSGPVQEVRAGFTQTYLSLGDSIAFGETVFSGDPSLGAYSDPSYGDRSYVRLFADYLASRDGGVRPGVVNLAIDGETSASFASGVGRVPPAAGFTDASLAGLNLNYAGATPPTQSSLLGSTIASESALGHIISNVSISLGSNDLFALALTDPNAVADLPAALDVFQANYRTLLTRLRSDLPAANIYLVGTYNPFTAAPGSPFAPFAGYAIPLLNRRVAVVASEFDAFYVPTYDTPLTTDAANFTLINAGGNVHPAFDKGYGVIAARMEAVPEPSSIAMLAVGLGGPVGLGYIRARCGRARIA